MAKVGAVLENFPARVEKSFGSTYERKIEAKKTSQQYVQPPKSAISTFDDGGQYPPKVNILHIASSRLSGIVARGFCMRVRATT